MVSILLVELWFLEVCRKVVESGLAPNGGQGKATKGPQVLGGVEASIPPKLKNANLREGRLPVAARSSDSSGSKSHVKSLQ